MKKNKNDAHLLIRLPKGEKKILLKNTDNISEFIRSLYRAKIKQWNRKDI